MQKQLVFSKGSTTPLKSHTALFEILLKSLILKSEISKNSSKVLYISIFAPSHMLRAATPPVCRELEKCYISRDATNPDI